MEKLKKNPLSTQIDLSKFSKDMFVPATEDEKRQQDVMSESTTFFKDGMRKLFKNPLAVGSIIVLACIILTIIIAPMIVPYSYEEILSVDGRRDKGAKNLAPFTYSKLEQQYIDKGGSRFPHIFGTDEQCRDYFIRVIYGTRISLAVGFFASIIVLIIGMLYGSVSGYLGGKVDLIMMRIVDIIYSLPDMLIIILLKVVLDERLRFRAGSFLDRLGTSMVSLFIVFGLLYWVGMARLIRGQILTIKENEYILAARSIGARPGRRKARAHHPQAHPAQLPVRHHHLHRPADPVRHLYRELSELYRHRRQGSHALPRLPGQCRARRPAELPLQAGLPGHHDLPDRAEPESAGRRSARCVRPEAEEVRT